MGAGTDYRRSLADGGRGVVDGPAVRDEVALHAFRGDGGSVVPDSQMLVTSSAVSDSLLVICIKPLTTEDERYANTFVLPIATPGLHVYCRRPYAPGQPSTFDYPLSSRFDESDALVVFD